MLGIRPEDMSIVESGQGYPARVAMISNLGSDQYLHVRNGELELTVRAPKGIRFQSGEQIGFSIAPELCHLFVDEKRVPLKTGTGL
ncbi:MAG: TOBE domain-containing protein [Deltaproteobacteria bacterium]|nr:TOBE domain-containing protein [Deltaproteobacteria bacterium]